MKPFYKKDIISKCKYKSYTKQIAKALKEWIEWNEKDTSNYQLKRQQDQCSPSDIESAPPNNTLVKTLDAKSNNNFDKDLDNVIATNSSTTDQQPDHFL